MKLIVGVALAMVMLTMFASKSSRPQDITSSLFQEKSATDSQAGVPCSGNEAMIDYISLSLTERISEASEIFIGVVKSVSRTQWNQDSGEYWEGMSKDGTTRHTALPYYVVTLTNIEPLFETDSVGEKEVTIVGKSPSDCESLQNSPLTPGATIVSFARSTELVWRNTLGKKSVLSLISDPDESFLILGKDGLFREIHGSDNKGITLYDLQRKIKGLR